MKSPRPGKPSAVSESLQSHLNMYALAASAAGVSVIALAPSAQAKVVYTPTHQVIGRNGVYNLDLNADGTVDFLIQQWNYGNWASNNQLFADAAVGNRVEGTGSRAAALSAGASIGPSQTFIGGGANGEMMLSVTHFTTGGTSYVHGFWANVKNRYLGLQFKIAGQTHYGWARLTVTREAFKFTATLSGYAYETTANTAIKAGQTTGGADTARINSTFDDIDTKTPRTKSLGELALGVLYVPLRRQP